MKSPFKFLDAFTAADREVFLGRDEEIATLYDMVMKNRLILVYGQSGTGKTSLIQCGLAGRFDATDWLPIFIRRQNDLNLSLNEQLSKLLDTPQVESPAKAAADLYMSFLRPVYLVFDQLEELFILGNEREQDIFIQSMRELLDSRTPCRILFVMREEYLAHLYRFEQVIPSLFDRRLRVEPMGTSKVQQVISGSFSKFNIQVEAPEQESYQQIVDNISGGKAGIQLPYLQVYLDTLYREDFTRTYPGQVAGDKGQWQPVVITRAEIQALGKIDNVMERFLRDQQMQLQRELAVQHPDIDEEAVKIVLDAFVSEEGTKRPIAYKWKGDQLNIDAAPSSLFQPLQADLISEICRKLEQARLLRFGDTHLELAHDTLAAVIDGQRTAWQRRLRDTYNRLMGAFRERKESGELLSRKQLNSMEELLPALHPRLNEDVRSFLQESRQHLEAMEQAELVAERKKRKMARRIAFAGFALAAIALAGLLAAVVQYRNAAINAATALKNHAHTLKVEGKYQEALEQMKTIEAYQNVLPSGEIDVIRQTRAAWMQISRLVQEGDSLSRATDYRPAIERYESAGKLDNDAHLVQLAEQARTDLNNAYEEAVRNGEILKNTQGAMDRAVAYFKKALQLKPGDPRAQRLLDSCKR